MRMGMTDRGFTVSLTITKFIQLHCGIYINEEKEKFLTFHNLS
jgi:hypothetical protein